MMSHLAVHRGNEGKPLEAPQEAINKLNHIVDSNRRTYAGMHPNLFSIVTNEIIIRVIRPEK